MSGFLIYGTIIINVIKEIVDNENRMDFNNNSIINSFIDMDFFHKVFIERQMKKIKCKKCKQMMKGYNFHETINYTLYVCENKDCDNYNLVIKQFKKNEK